MKLKVFVTALFVTGILLALLASSIIGPAPDAKATRPETVSYLIRMGTYYLITALVFVVTAIAAMRLARREREAYARERHENLRELIEGSLQDHERR